MEAIKRFQNDTGHIHVISTSIICIKDMNHYNNRLIVLKAVLHCAVALTYTGLVVGHTGPGQMWSRTMAAPWTESRAVTDSKGTQAVKNAWHRTRITDAITDPPYHQWLPGTDGTTPSKASPSASYAPKTIQKLAVVSSERRQGCTEKDVGRLTQAQKIYIQNGYRRHLRAGTQEEGSWSHGSDWPVLWRR